MVIVVRHCPAVVSYINFARGDAVALNDDVLGCLRNSDNLVSPNKTFVLNLVNEWVAAFLATTVKLGCIRFIFHEVTLHEFAVALLDIADR